jgi:hypothetical protein
MMKESTGEEPKMWGPGIVGFGSYHYKYASGREGDWFVVGFAPRQKDLTIYLMAGFDPFKHLMNRLGKYRTGKCCLHIRRLADVDLAVLEKLVLASVKHTRKTYG